MSITGIVIVGGIGYLIGKNQDRNPRRSTYHGHSSSPIMAAREALSDIVTRKLYKKFLGRETYYEYRGPGFDIHDSEAAVVEEVIVD